VAEEEVLGILELLDLELVMDFLEDLVEVVAMLVLQEA
jgi:hypothetical protein